MALYLLFAFTTAIASIILTLNPVLNDLEDIQPLNPLVQSRFITYIVFGTISIIIAPIMFIVSMIPTANKTFQKTLLEQIKD